MWLILHLAACGTNTTPNLTSFFWVQRICSNCSPAQSVSHLTQAVESFGVTIGDRKWHIPVSKNIVIVIVNCFCQLFGRYHPLVWQAVFRCFKGVLDMLFVKFVVNAEEGFLEVIGHCKFWDRLLHDLQRLLLCGVQVRGAFQGEPTNGLLEVDPLLLLNCT